MSEYVADLTIRRGAEGPQLVLGWTQPTDPLIVKVQVRRAEYDWPRSLTEGDLVVEYDPPVAGAEIEISDLDVVGQRGYYYTVFSIKGPPGNEVLYNANTQVAGLAFDNSDYPLRLWRQLPDVYRTMDIKATLKKILYHEYDGAEEFNFDEDQAMLYGQLRRFLKIFGIEIGLVRELAKYFEKFYDVEEVFYKFIPAIAFLIGLRLPSGISLARQRFLIATAAATFKIRGTVAGLSWFWSGNFGHEPTLTEFRNNVLITNQIDSVSQDFSIGVLQKWNTPEDSSDRVLDFRMAAELGPGAFDVAGRFNFRGLGIWFVGVMPGEITPEMIAAAREFFADFLPATVQWFMWQFLGDSWTEHFDFPVVPPTGWAFTDFGNAGTFSQGSSKLILDKSVPPPGVPEFPNEAVMKYPAVGLWGSINDNFFFEVDAQNIQWANVVLAGLCSFEFRVYFDTAPVQAYILVQTLIAAGNQFAAQWFYRNSSGGTFSGGYIYPYPPTPTTMKIRVERSIGGVMKVYIMINGTWYWVGNTTQTYFAGSSLAGIEMRWRRGGGTVSGLFHIEHDKVVEMDWAGTGQGWERLVP